MNTNQTTSIAIRADFSISILISLVLLAILVTPVKAAAFSGEVAGWIPWWAAEEGAESALKNLDELDTIYPFVFEVTSNGQLVNKTDFDDEHWEDLFDEARDEGVEIIPTIAWFEGDQIHKVLSNKKTREQHIEDIVDMVDEYDFAGVDIDYEGKNSETIDDFSEFLEELKDELGRKQILACTVEARTPPDSLYHQVPKTINYANDYKEINKHCDRIEIMAYDQQRADLKLNKKRQGLPYAPVADKEWVEKVIDLALEDFDEDKVVLGVATYGRAWDITVAPDWYKDYKRVATLNQPRILELADKYNSGIGRSAGGEAVISYFPEDSIWKIFDQLPTPKGTPAGYEAAAKALLVATVADIELPVRFVNWSDALAVDDKLELADKYNLRGVAVFKIDGEEDKKIWNLF